MTRYQGKGLREIGMVVMGEEMTGEEEVQGIDHEWEAQLALPIP